MAFCQASNYHGLVMNLLGPSLNACFKQCKKKFTLNTVVEIGSQIIDIIEIFHEYGFIHRDIKPNNFLIGTKENSKKIYLIDFGLSILYRSTLLTKISLASTSLIPTSRDSWALPTLSPITRTKASNRADETI